MIPLADVADGIFKAVLAEGGNRATSRATGRAETCVRRYGANPEHWPLDAALHLAARQPDLRRAIIAFINPTEFRVQGQSIAVETDIRDTVGEMGRMIGSLMCDMRDGRVSAVEARLRAPEVEALIEHLQRLHSDLVAKGKAR